MKPLFFCYRDMPKAVFLFTSMAVTIIFFSPGPTLGQAEDPLRILQTQVNAIEIHQKTQQDEDQWVEEKSRMEGLYLAAVEEETALLRHKSGLEVRIAQLQARQIEARRKAAETAHLNKALNTHLDKIVGQLAGLIKSDLPFLLQERTDRIKAVKTALILPDTSMAEKCLRVLEALKVEAEYGITVEVYQQEILPERPGGATPVMADILRVGRLALFWRTPDGKTTGHWNRAAGKWAVLPGTYRRHINDAIEMALKRRTMELVKLPLGRIAVQ
jgi:hypothetical protein